jgi:hypothetical protein
MNHSIFCHPTSQIFERKSKFLLAVTWFLSGTIVSRLARLIAGVPDLWSSAWLHFTFTIEVGRRRQVPQSPHIIQYCTCMSTQKLT